MPIKPENRALYPADWGEISLGAKRRANWTCMHMGCLARQYDVGYWPIGLGTRWVALERFVPDLITEGAYTVARQRAAEIQWSMTGDVPQPDPAIIVIVLTTAHLDHDPKNCAPDNLAPMCQRHHLAYDHRHHMESAYATRRAGRAIGDLFLPIEEPAAGRPPANNEGTT